MALDLEAANELISRAFEHAAQYEKSFSAAVVDAGGYLIAVQRQDFTRPLSPMIAISKAYSAAIMQRPITALASWEEHEPTFFSHLSKFGMFPIVAAMGGFPLSRNGEVLGGIGVSGGLSDEDEASAEAALKVLNYDLEFNLWPRRH